MLHKLRRFYDIYLSTDSAAAQDPEQATRLATAALLMEMARMDENIAPDERRRVTQALQDFFQLHLQQIVRLPNEQELHGSYLL